MSLREPDVTSPRGSPEHARSCGRSGTGSASALEAWIDDLRRAEKRQLQAQGREQDPRTASGPAEKA